MIQTGCSEKQIFIFNLDLVTDLQLFASQQKFIDFIKERIGKNKLYIFIDEAQRVENTGSFFKGVYDMELPVKLVLTGSSSLEIKSKIHESLTGRKRVFELYPLNFTEYITGADQILSELIHRQDISDYSQNQLFRQMFNFINWGGYPKPAIEQNIAEKKDLLKEIFSSYIEKDIAGFLKIKNYTAYSRLVSLLGSQIGQLVNIYEISQTLKIDRKILEKYLLFLEKTFIIKIIPPWFKNYRKEITKMPKIYFLDTGLRNFSLNSFGDFDLRQDKGALLENFIFTEIFKNSDYKINYWRTKEKAEVDFIISTTEEKIIPIEIKSAMLKKPEIPRGLQNFITHYKPQKTILVNLGWRGKSKLDSTEIFFIYPYEIGKII